MVDTIDGINNRCKLRDTSGACVAYFVVVFTLTVFLSNDTNTPGVRPAVLILHPGEIPGYKLCSHTVRQRKPRYNK